MLNQQKKAKVKIIAIITIIGQILSLAAGGLLLNNIKLTGNKENNDQFWHETFELTENQKSVLENILESREETELNANISGDISITNEEISTYLMEAINNNPGLSDKEKECLKNYRLFFNDYGHLIKNPEKTAQTLRDVIIEYTGEDHGVTLATYKAKENKIYIYANAGGIDDLSNDFLYSVLPHEVGHAIEYSGYDLTKETNVIGRSTVEGINSIITFEYFSEGRAVKADYNRLHAIHQVLIEIVGPEMAVNMWLNDSYDEVYNELAEILETIDYAATFFEQLNKIENAVRARNVMNVKYEKYDMSEITKLDWSDEELEEIYDDIGFIEYVERIHEESLKYVSETLKEYYEEKFEASIENDPVVAAYFDIINNFRSLDDVTESITCVDKPLINKDKLGEKPRFLYFDIRRTDYSQKNHYDSVAARFYEADIN